MTRVAEIPKTSKAAIITEFNAPLEVRELPIPQLEHGALLIRVEAATVCGSDVHVWDGSINGSIRPINLPVVPGHEMVGRIVAFGDGAQFDVVGSPLQIGDRIIFTFSNCDHCMYCTVLRMPNLCSSRRSYGANAETYPYLVGGFAEYCYVYPGSRRIKIPEGVKPEWASAASCALRSVVGAFHRLGAIEPWETVTIQGSGPLGLFATALASISGAARIIVIGDPAERLKIAEDWGATDVVSVAATADGEARVQAVRDLTGGAGSDIVMEFSGARTAFTEGIGMIRRGGRYVVAGQVGPQEVAFRPTQITQGGLTILGSFSAGDSEYWKAIQFMDRYKERFDFDRILSNRFHLDQVHDALTRMQTLQEIKPVIIPTIS